MMLANVSSTFTTMASSSRRVANDFICEVNARDTKKNGHQSSFAEIIAAIEAHGVVQTKFLRGLFFLACVSCAASASARDYLWESGQTRTHLIELFTSEGCSSCPPAEAWLSKLKTNARLWKDFVPVAFHVDYWDNLGWPDRFAAKPWTERQRTYATTWNTTTVYTPEFILDGREWHAGQIPLASTDRPGVLKVALAEHGTAAISFNPEAAGARSFDVYLAALGFSLNSDVNAGENRGRKLQHDFVVLSLVKEPMTAHAAEVRVSIDALRQKQREVGAVAVWITEPGLTEPVQAVAGWLR
jgi:hypothetical protein